MGMDFTSETVAIRVMAPQSSLPEFTEPVSVLDAHLDGHAEAGAGRQLKHVLQLGMKAPTIPEGTSKTSSSWICRSRRAPWSWQTGMLRSIISFTRSAVPP